MAGLQCSNLSLAYDTTMALDGVDLDVDQGSVLAVMGPSGSGKSSLLRCIAGLATPATGTVRWNGISLDGVPPHQRRIGFMFQDYALFPHRTVAGNVAFGLTMAGHGAATIKGEVATALAMVGLEGFEDRSINGLSGGEQQRVAFARSLAPHPEVLLLDEPLGALDRSLRDTLLHEMRNVFTTTGITAIYVTHDPEEAFAIADSLAVMDHGRIVAVGRPADVWHNPGTVAVASLLGHDNIVDTTTHPEVVGGRRGFVLIPAVALTITDDPPNATVTDVRFEAGAYRTTLEIGGTTLVLTLTHSMQHGANVHVDVDTAAVVDLRD